MSQNKIPSPGHSILKRAFGAAVLITTLVAIAVSTAGLMEVKEVADVLNAGSKKLDVGDEITRAEAGKPQTFLLIGSDHRWVDQDEPAHSDTLLLVRLDPDRDVISMMSIPRDLKVPIPGVGLSKINDAYYSGGAKLTVKVVKDLLGIKINHVASMYFGGFRRAVNQLGCIYIDVDHRYFNDNSGPGPDWAVIDIQPGYQKLCGQDALDYVRFRHYDNDFVRASRQQDFLRQVKAQIGPERIFNERREFIKLIGRYSDTDHSLSTTKELLRVFKLAAFAAKNPIREVHFRAEAVNEGKVSYVVSSPEMIQRSVREFLNGKTLHKATKAAKSVSQHHHQQRRRKHHKGKVAVSVPGLVEAPQAGKAQAEKIAEEMPASINFPIYYPTVMFSFAEAKYSDPRVYKIRRNGHHYWAYRIVANKGSIGEYYGVQAMTWLNPPILDDNAVEEHLCGRALRMYYDGGRLRMVAWRSGHVVYWVSNTLMQTLSKQQMVAITCSLKLYSRGGAVATRPATQ